MEESVKKEIKEYIKTLKLNCSINEFKDLVDWNDISYYQKLSEKFIREFKDLVDWNNISYDQELSESFIYEFRNKLNIEKLIERELITEERLNEFEKLEKEHLKKISKRSYRFSIMDI